MPDAEAAEPIVEFDKIAKRFGPLTVMGDVDFVVHPGENIAILGPSGTGKSVFLTN